MKSVSRLWRVRAKDWIDLSPCAQEPFATILQDNKQARFFSRFSQYGLPAIWIKLSDRLVGGEFKFHDHYAFMEVDAPEIPRWNFDQTIAQNLAKATCPPIPAIAKTAPEMLRDVLEANGHA